MLRRPRSRGTSIPIVLSRPRSRGTLQQLFEHRGLRAIVVGDVKVGGIGSRTQPRRIHADIDRFCVSGGAIDLNHYVGLMRPYGVLHFVGVPDSVENFSLMPLARMYR